MNVLTRKSYLVVVIIHIVICYVSADLSKFYKGGLGGIDYDDYNFDSPEYDDGDHDEYVDSEDRLAALDQYEEEYDGDFEKYSLSGSVFESQETEEAIVKKYISDATGKDLKQSSNEKKTQKNRDTGLNQYRLTKDTKDYYEEDESTKSRKTTGRINKQPNVKTESAFSPKQGIDFSECEDDLETGHCCITKEEQINSLEKKPIMECTHHNVEQCHYTYITEFRPTQEEFCEETFEKKCSISFQKKANNETIEKCYNPLVRICEDEASSGDENSPRQQGQYGAGQKIKSKGKIEEKCKTYFESSCTTRYVEKHSGKFIGNTSCEKYPVELCGKGQYLWLLL